MTERCNGCSFGCVVNYEKPWLSHINGAECPEPEKQSEILREAGSVSEAILADTRPPEQIIADKWPVLATPEKII